MKGLPEFSPEARSWRDGGGRRDRPYGAANIGHGLWLLTAVATENAFDRVTDKITDKGCLRVKIVNLSMRRPPSLTVLSRSLEPDRIWWLAQNQPGQMPVRTTRLVL